MTDEEIMRVSGGKCTPEQILYLLDRVRGQGFLEILNIGVYKGGSAVALGLACRERGEGHVHCVDSWTERGVVYEDAYKSFRRKIVNHRLEGICLTYRMDSSSFFQECQHAVDFAFVDGDHTEEGAKSDIIESMRLGAKEIVVHDFEDYRGRSFWRFPARGVKKAVRRLEQERHVRIVDTDCHMARLVPFNQ